MKGAGSIEGLLTLLLLGFVGLKVDDELAPAVPAVGF